MTCYIIKHSEKQIEFILSKDFQNENENENKWTRILYEELLYTSLMNSEYEISDSQGHIYTFQTIIKLFIDKYPYLLYTFPVYYKLRSEGWYISSGHTTGTNFMLYPGQPDDYHALCTVFIVLHQENKDKKYMEYIRLLKEKNIEFIKKSLKGRISIEDCTLEPFLSTEKNDQNQSDIQIQGLDSIEDSYTSISNSYLQRIIRISESIHKPLLLIYAKMMNCNLNESIDQILDYLNQYQYISTFIERFDIGHPQATYLKIMKKNTNRIETIQEKRYIDSETEGSIQKYQISSCFSPNLLFDPEDDLQ